MGARREYKDKEIPFTNVTGLRTTYAERYLRLVEGDLWLSANGKLYRRYNPRSGALTGETQVEARLGDVIVFSYSTNAKRRQWDHAGVLYERATASRLLNGNDSLLHAGPAEAHIDRLSSEKFVLPTQPTRIAILRWLP